MEIKIDNTYKKEIIKDEAQFNDFLALDIRIGTIIETEYFKNLKDHI